MQGSSSSSSYYPSTPGYPHYPSTPGYPQPNFQQNHSSFFPSAPCQGHVFVRLSPTGINYSPQTRLNEKWEKAVCTIANRANAVLNNDLIDVCGEKGKIPDPCPKFLSNAINFLRGFTYIDNSTNINVNGGNKSKAETAETICKIGVGILLGAAFVFGWCYGSYSNSQDELKAKISYENQLYPPYALAPDDTTARNSIQIIFENYTQLLTKELNRNKRNCFATVALIAGGGALAVGGGIGSSAVMFVGGTITVATVAAYGLKFFFDYRRENYSGGLATPLNDQTVANKILKEFNNLK
jgi:hypothetical protein